jgi:sortase A
MRRLLALLERVLWAAALAALGWCAFVLTERHIFQARQDAALRRQIEAHAARGAESPVPAPPPPPPPAALPRESAESECDPEPAWVEPPPLPPPGTPVGRLEIPRLKVSAIVCEGTDDATLRLCVGHISGTALPSDGASNVALAGHRDSFFRRLGILRRGDVLRLTTPDGSRVYRVEWRGIVAPEDTEVLDPSVHPSLTLITCFPFRYIGAAPRRYVVRAVSLEDIRG